MVQLRHLRVRAITHLDGVRYSSSRVRLAITWEDVSAVSPHVARVCRWLCAATKLLVFHLRAIALNLTTNEIINKARYARWCWPRVMRATEVVDACMGRYGYLRDGQGRFWNPFDKGPKLNFLAFLR